MMDDAVGVVAEPRVSAPQVANDVDAAGVASPEPRRRGRPRRERPVEDAESTAIEADRLPPALSPGNDAGEPAAEEPKPRRRRLRTAQGTDAASE
jgi:hypothetical protein